MNLVESIYSTKYFSLKPYYGTPRQQAVAPDTVFSAGLLRMLHTKVPLTTKVYIMQGRFVIESIMGYHFRLKIKEL
jgi:hypothetical protein